MPLLVSRSKATPSEDGRQLWERVFGVDKESARHPRSRPGGLWGASTLATDASVKRLIQAMRSMAPGGWSDDRWEQTKHQVGITHICIHRTGEQLAQAEYQVFIEDESHPDGKRPITRTDPPHGDRSVQPWELVELLKHPNRQDSFGDLMYRWNQQMNLTGKALTWMLPNQIGVPMELYSIPTAIAIPQPTINPDYPDGFYRIQPVYPYGPFSSYPTPSTSVGAPIPAQWMMEFKFPHPLLRYDGYSPQTALRLHMDELEAIDRSRWYTTQKSMRPSAVLNFEEIEGMQGLPEAEILRIHAEWENEMSRPENHGKLIVGTPGGKFEPWGSNPIDMDYPEGWNQLTSFLMAAFGITKPAAGMIEDSSYASLFATLKQLHLLTLEPMCNRIAAQLTRRVAPFFGDRLIIEIRCKRIDDHDVLQSKLKLLMEAKAIKKNEIRKMLDIEVTKEEWGEEMAGEDKAEQQMEQQKLEMQQQAKQPVPEDERQEPKEVTRSQPKPGPLGVGALGPRDAKSLYHRVRKVLCNGRA